MATAVVKLNALPDTVRSTSKNEDLFVGGWLALTVPIVAGVHVWSDCLKFRRTGVHPFH